MKNHNRPKVDSISILGFGNMKINAPNVRLHFIKIIRKKLFFWG